MISYDDSLLDAQYEQADDNRFMDYEALGRYYTQKHELTQEDIENIREAIHEHLVEVRQELSEVTGKPVDEIKRETENILESSETFE